MKTCVCKVIFPNVVRTCLQCGRELPRASGGAVTVVLRKQMGYPAPKDAEERLFGEIMEECLAFYEMHAGRLQNFRKERIKHHLKALFTKPLLVSALEDRARDLIKTLFDLGQLGAEFQEREEAKRREVEQAAEDHRRLSSPDLSSLREMICEETQVLIESGVSPEGVAQHVASLVEKALLRKRPAKDADSSPSLTPDLFKEKA